VNEIDTTQRSIELPFSGEIDNNYYEGLLDKEDKAILDGFDMALETITDAWCNLDENDIELVRAGLDPKEVNEEVLDFDDLSDEWAYLTKETRLVAQLKWHIEEYLETMRSEFVVSMIDNMDEKKYRKRYKKVFGKDCRVCSPKE